MLTCAPGRTVIVGLTSPATRNVSSGPLAGPASTARFTLVVVVVVKVMVRAARFTWAPAGTCAPSPAAVAGLTRGPGALVHRRPMNCPMSGPLPIMAAGSLPPRIQPGAPVPPIIHRYPAAPIIQCQDRPPIIEPPIIEPP